MKAIATAITSILFFILMLGATVQGQEQHPPEEHPAPAEAPHPAPQPHAQPARPAQPPHQEQPKSEPHPPAHAEPQTHPQPPEHAEHPSTPAQAAPPQHHREAHPPSAINKAEPVGREPQTPPHARPARPQPVPTTQAPPQHTHHNQPQHAPTPEEHRNFQQVWQQHRSEHWQTDHRDWAARGGYQGYRIPDTRYHMYFGRSHSFRIYSLPFVASEGYPRFQYEGYWVSLLDPWPYDWAPDWYDTDPVYITWMNGGYYLIDPRYPDYPLAVMLSQ